MKHRIAVRAVGLGKEYRIAAMQARYETLRENLVRSFRSACSRPWRRHHSTIDERPYVWALRDVSLEVASGEVVGIVGRNGAGKSTLLKILSRITEPTAGYAQVYGRVGSLIEVGTGFHPELTGRENVLLNGSILGMRRAEIQRRFDEIIDFAEIGPFVDTPVKHYSSGMYMRLAFAVAAHLEPEILLIDEVLAVGDAEFQKKCLGRMNEVSREGRTVLFVSHNMHAVQRLCTRCVLLDKGRVVTEGPTPMVIREYLSSGAHDLAVGDWLDLSTARRTGSGDARYTAIRCGSRDATIGWRLHSEGSLVVSLVIQSAAEQQNVSIAVAICDQHGTKLINTDSDMLGDQFSLPAGPSAWSLTIESLHLKPGIYVVGLYLADRFGGVFDRIEAAVQIEVVEIVAPKLGTRIDPRYDGVVTCRFDIQRTEDAVPRRA